MPVRYAGPLVLGQAQVCVCEWAAFVGLIKLTDSSLPKLMGQQLELRMGRTPPSTLRIMQGSELSGHLFFLAGLRAPGTAWVLGRWSWSTDLSLQVPPFPKYPILPPYTQDVYFPYLGKYTSEQPAAVNPCEQHQRDSEIFAETTAHRSLERVRFRGILPTIDVVKASYSNGAQVNNSGYRHPLV